MRAVNIYATRTALTEWAGQGYVNKVDGVSLDPRIESFGANTRLAIEVQRYGSYLTTVYAYATTAIRNADTGRDTNVGGVVFADSTAGNNDLAFWSGSAWVADSVIGNALKTALTAVNASLVLVTGVPVPGAPGQGVPANGAPGQFLGVNPDSSTAWQAASAIIAALGLDARYPQISLLGYSANDLAILTRDAALLARSAAMKRPKNARYTRAFWEYNLLPIYGQSLGEGREAYARWVAEDVATRNDTWMIGNSVRPQSGTNPAWVPFGTSALVPLKSNVDDANGNIQTPAQVDALPVGSLNNGENVMVGATRYVARAFEDDYLQQRHWVAGSACVGGQTIEALSPGASPLLYNRLEQLFAAFVAAVPSGNSRGIPAYTLMQGESNYSGGDQTKAGYKTKLVSLKSNIDAAIAFAMGISGRAPAMLIYQTGASWSDDTRQLAIGMAQWEVSRERTDVIMVGPTYPVSDKNGHLSANGTRWFGQQIGKVFHRTIIKGEGWEPLSPLWTEARGSTLYIGFHVPEPPLAFDLPYVVNTATDFAAKGFRVQDSAGDITITGVRILGSCIVAVDLARSVGASPFVWYAGKATFNGNGCLRDNDPTIADADYVGTDIAALAGNPYPLHNWSIAYCLPVGWSR